MLLSGEVEVPNPGHKRCRLCGGLILGPTMIRFGCNNRCPGCPRQATSRSRQPAIKRLMRNPARKLSYLVED